MSCILRVNKNILYILDWIPIYTKIPGCAKDVKGLGKAVVINKTSVDCKQSHQHDDVASFENCIKHLRTETMSIYERKF